MKTTTCNQFASNPEMALESVGAVSRILISFAAEEGETCKDDRYHEAASFYMLANLLADAYAVLYDATADFDWRVFGSIR